MISERALRLNAEVATALNDVREGWQPTGIYEPTEEERIEQILSSIKNAVHSAFFRARHSAVIHDIGCNHIPLPSGYSRDDCKIERLPHVERVVFDTCAEAGLNPTLEPYDDDNWSGWHIVIHW